MLDFLYHATGLCGEHTHPSLLLLAFGVAVVAGVFIVTRNRKRGNRVHY